MGSQSRNFVFFPGFYFWKNYYFLMFLLFLLSTFLLVIYFFFFFKANTHIFFSSKFFNHSKTLNGSEKVLEIYSERYKALEREREWEELFACFFYQFLDLLLPCHEFLKAWLSSLTRFSELFFQNSSVI